MYTNVTDVDDAKLEKVVLDSVRVVPWRTAELPSEKMRVTPPVGVDCWKSSEFGANEALTDVSVAAASRAMSVDRVPVLVMDTLLMDNVPPLTVPPSLMKSEPATVKVQEVARARVRVLMMEVPDVVTSGVELGDTHEPLHGAALMEIDVIVPLFPRRTPRIVTVLPNVTVADEIEAPAAANTDPPVVSATVAYTPDMVRLLHDPPD